ncbi:MAG: hypothetical protein LQ338_007496 [Usnochroma carphineum]|nr:MAG: hypothetical protein LQ338_007496 [Usnochroma carphineum]
MGVSCSCALRWVDPAGIFHRVCQSCDARRLNLEPDLSFVLDNLDTAGAEPLPGFGEMKLPKTPTRHSPIHLPTIEECRYDDEPAPATPSKLNLDTLALQTPAAKRATPSKLNLDALALQTPAAKRRKLDLRGPYPSNIVLYGSPAPDRYQWTPKAQRTEDIIDAFENAMIPKEPSDDDSGDEQAEPRSVKRAKKARFRRWAARAKRKSGDLIDDGEEEENGLTFEEFVEEEKMVRKKPRYI